MTRRRINFDTFGDRATASSRLRAWMLADELQHAGHAATVNGALDVDIQVFQKRRDAARLRTAKGHGARIVFDFDDHYLLEDSGARDDILAFMNLADVVTVGSQELLEHASRYHRHVVLFENPLDISAGLGSRPATPWRGNLGWFGASANQGGLYALGLRDRVTTVTTGGDIPWSLETIDTVLQGFDLVVLPVETSAWTLAKNANRLFKCVALGVPFLASSTPEHQHAVRRLELPEWLLVEPGEDWTDRIAEIRERAHLLPQLLGRARVRALEQFGIAPVARRWLQAVTSDHPAAPLALSPAARAALAYIDVVILGEDAPARVPDTLRSLAASGAHFRSLSVLSALPIPVDGVPDDAGTSLCVDQYADFFDLYSDLSHVLGSRTGAATLILQGGVLPAPGFFHDAATFDPAAITLFRTQEQRTALALSGLPPTLLDTLLTRPYRPPAVLLPNASALPAAFQPQFGPFASWEHLIALAGEHGAPVHAVSTPLLMVAPDLVNRTPLQTYGDLLALRDPVAASDLPSGQSEWDRLQFTLHAAVVEAHAEVFRPYQSTLLPRLAQDVRHAQQQRTEHQRERERTGRWLAQLRTQPPGVTPRLRRAPDGAVYLLDGALKRHVATWLIARALEDLFGPIELDEDLAAYAAGPPANLLSDADGRIWLVAGRQRYLVRAFPVPSAAGTDQLAAFPEAASPLDVYRSVERVLRRPAAKPASAKPAASKAAPPAPGEPPPPDPAPGEPPLAAPHQDTWLTPEQLGAARPYQPTFTGPPVINDLHRTLLEAPLQAGSVSIQLAIPGALRREDAAKLFELAYHGAGNALVFGAGHGLPAAIIAESAYSAGRPCAITVVDAEPRAIARAREHLAPYDTLADIALVTAEPEAFCRAEAARGHRYGLVFVDHVTSAVGIAALSALLPPLIAPGGFVLFHDFNDRRNRATRHDGAYGVYAGVLQGLPMPPFAFYGAYGCTGVFRHAAALGASATPALQSASGGGGPGAR
ncbi:MAG: hypothetical protein QM692_05420 [Thermomicrobiales bacterium]